MAATSPWVAGTEQGALGSYNNNKSLHKTASKQDNKQKAEKPVWGQALQSSGDVVAGLQSTEMHGGLVVTRR